MPELGWAVAGLALIGCVEFDGHCGWPTITAQMTLIHPDMTVAVMDAISQAWHHGRTVTPKNLSCEHWEDRVGDDVNDLRDRARLAW